MTVQGLNKKRTAQFDAFDPITVLMPCDPKRVFDREVEVTYLVKDGFQGLTCKYDVILASAIPATPSAPRPKRPLNPLFEGTQLLEEVVRDSPQHLTKGGHVIISHSSVGEEAFQEAAKKFGAKVAFTSAKRDVPFRVEFLGDQEWVDFLVERGGLRKEDKRGYPYWHTVTVKHLEYN